MVLSIFDENNIKEKSELEENNNYVEYLYCLCGMKWWWCIFFLIYVISFNFPEYISKNNVLACKIDVTIVCYLTNEILQIKEFNGFSKHIKETRGKSRTGTHIFCSFNDLTGKYRRDILMSFILFIHMVWGTLITLGNIRFHHIYINSKEDMLR